MVDEREPSSKSVTVPSSGALNQSEASSAAHRQEHTHPTVDVPLRLEGPYFTPVDPALYRTVVCFVAGTGVSGAIAIANAFTELERTRASTTESISEAHAAFDNKAAAFVDFGTITWRKCVVVWSVRAEDYVDLPFFKGT